MLHTLWKWLTRKWSNWEYYDTLERYYKDNLYPVETFEVQKRTSNDGLVQYRRVKI